MNYIYSNDCTISNFLFKNKKSAILWLVIRAYVGWQWLTAGWEKINSPSWVGADAGKALTGFLKGSLAKTAGVHPDVQSWYGYFLEHFVINHVTFWSYLVAWGEVVVGIALIVGIFVGAAAFFGFFMNLNYLLAGTVSTNPILLVLSIGLILAWRVAGYIGADRFLWVKKEAQLDSSDKIKG